MSNIYQDVADAVVDRFEADTWLGDTDNVKTIDTDLDDTDLPVLDKFARLKDSVLPAVLVRAAEDPGEAGDATVGETEHRVALTVYACCMRRTEREARQQALDLGGAVEASLVACRKSQNALAVTGSGNFVRRVGTSAEVIRGEAERRCYGIATTRATVVVVRSL